MSLTQKPDKKWRYQKVIITSRHGQKLFMYRKLFTYAWPRDILQLIAARITTRSAWQSFALTCKKCAQVCRNIVLTQKKIILKNDPLPVVDYYDWFYAKYLMELTGNDTFYGRRMRQIPYIPSGDVYLCIPSKRIKQVRNIKLKFKNNMKHFKNKRKYVKNTFNSGR